MFLAKNSRSSADQPSIFFSSALFTALFDRRLYRPSIMVLSHWRGTSRSPPEAKQTRKRGFKCKFSSEEEFCRTSEKMTVRFLWSRHCKEYHSATIYMLEGHFSENIDPHIKNAKRGIWFFLQEEIFCFKFYEKLKQVLECI